ncbi:hypothetical protein NE237_021059 [Protea cynaroides]|uniref:Uncharacterized protein n=1 Tax=Protea cynaroides TaxID=273540 RepID=A0A9Q0HCE5_9MAGN|nr:hypothetical protein NE237_021059 [Protea cynaroides]
MKKKIKRKKGREGFPSSKMGRSCWRLQEAEWKKEKKESLFPYFIAEQEFGDFFARGARGLDLKISIDFFLSHLILVIYRSGRIPVCSVDGMEQRKQRMAC